ncbi:MAG: tRNA (N(6)-L-threonylcarbamoyladenosine(37)-C(2))-methylthiotransferase MtaB [Nitrospirota bacterium]
MRVAFTTLGCKINQHETEIMRREAAAAGNAIVPFDSEADVYVINTCSVTAKSDYQCRQTIRAALRRGQGARVMVTGCYAETRPEEIKSIPGVALVFGNQEKNQFARYLDGQDLSSRPAIRDLRQTAKTRTRGFLKIQDGCDNHCTYCIVPLARGASRSVPAEEVRRTFDLTVGSGCPEVVLSGIHIGRYGLDLAPRETLTGLMQSLVLRKKHARIRLSSIEPNEITDEIIAMLGDGLCRHLHIPLQSGDDLILRSMNRTYTSQFYRQLIEKVALKVPGAALGADVMVGFPGEGERAFRNTYDLVADLPLTHLHVFSYSPRPGTPAAVMEGQVPDGQKKERSELLRDLGNRKNLAFRSRFKGTVMKTVLEEGSLTEQGHVSGLTDNYIRVQVKHAIDADFGREINIFITDVQENGVSGDICRKLLIK